MTANGETTTWICGATNDVTGTVYLQKQGEDTVYLVDTNKVTVFEKSRMDLAIPVIPPGTLLPARLHPVKRLPVRRLPVKLSPVRLPPVRAAPAKPLPKDKATDKKKGLLQNGS